VSWNSVAVLPNIRIADPVEGDRIAIASALDERVATCAAQHPQLKDLIIRSSSPLDTAQPPVRRRRDWKVDLRSDELSGTSAICRNSSAHILAATFATLIKARPHKVIASSRVFGSSTKQPCRRTHPPRRRRFHHGHQAMSPSALSQRTAVRKASSVCATSRAPCVADTRPPGAPMMSTPLASMAMRRR
jgi:hypothetical protein